MRPGFRARRRFVPRWACLVSATIALIAGPIARAQVSTDGSMGPKLDPVPGGESAPGLSTDYLITEDLGQVRGQNLFHSFSRFDVPGGESATFSAANPFDNVIARVTGAGLAEPGASIIDGTLRSTVDRMDGSGAALWLLNPRGIVFGQSSSIDVPGSLHLSTAHELHFADGAVFPTGEDIPHGDLVLSAAAPSAFGFLGAGPSATVEFAGPSSGDLVHTLESGSTLSLSGRDVIANRRVRLQSPSGRIQMAGVGTTPTVLPVDFSAWDPNSVNAPGLVRLSQSVRASTTTFDGTADQGQIVIRGGRFELAGSFLSAGGTGPGDQAAIDVDTSGDTVIEAVTADWNPALTLPAGLQAEAPGAAAGGDIRVRAGRFELGSLSRLVTDASNLGAGGDIVVRAGSIDVHDSALMFTRTRGAGANTSGGDIVLDSGTGDLSIRSGSQITTQTLNAGDGGDIVIIGGAVSIDDGQVIVESGSMGRGGSVSIRAESLLVTGDAAGSGSDEAAGISSFNRIAAIRDAGDEGTWVDGGSIILVVAGELRIDDGAALVSEARSSQRGGLIEISAGSIALRDGGAIVAMVADGTVGGLGGDIQIDAGDVSMLGGGPGTAAPLISSEVRSTASGASGDITIDAASLIVRDGGQISASSFGPGVPGAIRIDTSGDVELSGQASPGNWSGVFSRQEQSADGDGAGGTIEVTAQNIRVADSAQVSARSFTSNRSGSVLLVARDSVRITGALDVGSTVSARGGSGPAGTILVDAPLVEVLGGGRIDAETASDAGGVILIRADSLRVAGEGPGGSRSAIATGSIGSGRAGDIVIEAVDRVAVLDRGEISSSTTTDIGAAGDIVVTRAGLVQVASGGRITVASEPNGGGNPDPGSIRVEEIGQLVIEDGGQVIASGARNADGGSITVAADTISLDGGGIVAQAEQGAGGDLSLDATGSIEVEGRSTLTVKAEGAFDAGTISLRAASVEIIDSTLTATAAAYGGNIEIEASELVEIVRSDLAATSFGESGEDLAGGNIFIDPPNVVINSSFLLADGQGNANGGNISIIGNAVVISADSDLRVSSDLGVDGIKTIESADNDLAADVTTLPENTADAAMLLRQACLVRQDAHSASLVVRGGYVVREPPDRSLSLDADHGHVGTPCGEG